MCLIGMKISMQKKASILNIRFNQSSNKYIYIYIQAYVPLEACVLKVNDAFIVHPKEAQNHFHRL